MEFLVALDERMAEMMEVFAPWYNIIDLDVSKINGNLFLPSTFIGNLANYLQKLSPQDEKCMTFGKLMESSVEVEA